MAAEKTVEEKQSKRRRRRQAEEEVELSGKGRVTPGRRNKEEKSEGNFLTRPFSGILNYFQEVSAELEKVSWPTREESIRLAQIVLMVTVLSALVLGGLSVLAGAYLDLGLQNEIVFVVTFLGIIAGGVVMMRRGLL
jgi:preprotein translocase subunit SecE